LKLAGVTLLAAVLAVLPPTASASFPGGNGKLAFGRGVLIPEEIAVINPDGSGRRRIVPAGGIAVGEPAWSADGRRIAYTRLSSVDVQTGRFRAAIYTAGATGGSRRRVISGPVGQPSWAPDGRRIAFRRGTRGGIWIMNADGSDQKRLTRGADLSPDWSPDGARILFVRGDALYVVNTDGGGLRRLAPRSLEVRSADWSPDAARVVFATGRGLYTAAADGSGRARLRGTRSLDLTPVWSPDGAEIAFTRLTLGGRSDVYRLPAAGGRPRRVTRDGRSQLGDWQPVPG
jgi:TolB protein